RSAFLLFQDGWSCQTRQRHKDREFGCNLFGLIRHMVFKLTDQVLPWKDAWRYAQAHVGDLRELVGDRARAARAGAEHEPVISFRREALMSCLEVPAALYLGRGYRPETLAHFGVGACVRPLPDGRDLRGWPVFPVALDASGRNYGYTARNPRWRA